MRPHRFESPPASLSLLLLGATFLLLIGCKQFKQSYNKSFKESFQTSYVTSCVNAATAKGAASAAVKPYCECTATYLVDHHDSTELTKISTNTDSPEAKQALTAASRACAVAVPTASAQ